MKFSDFICRDAILSTMHATDKEGAIREMVELLRTANQIDAAQTESIIRAILKREELGTTGIGHGVAVPHTKHPSVERLIGAVAVSPGGIDFASLDGEVVHLFFLVVSPPDLPSEHLRALEHISRQLRNDTFSRFLKHAKGPAEIQQLLDEADSSQFGP